MVFNKKHIASAALVAMALSATPAHALAGHPGNTVEQTAEFDAAWAQLANANSQEEIETFVQQVMNNPEKFFKESDTFTPIFGGIFSINSGDGPWGGGIYRSFAGMETPLVFGHYTNVLEQQGSTGTRTEGTVSDLELTPLGKRVLYVSLALAAGVNQETGEMSPQLEQLLAQSGYVQTHDFAQVAPLTHLIKTHLEQSENKALALNDIAYTSTPISESYLDSVVTEADLTARVIANAAGLVFSQRSHMSELSDAEQVAWVREQVTSHYTSLQNYKYDISSDVFADALSLIDSLLKLAESIPESNIEAFQTTPLTFVSLLPNEAATHPSAAGVAVGLEHGKVPLANLLQQHGITTGETPTPETPAASEAPAPTSETPDVSEESTPPSETLDASEESTPSTTQSPEVASTATLANTGVPALAIVALAGLSLLAGAVVKLRKR